MKSPYEIVFGRPYPHHVHMPADMWDIKDIHDDTPQQNLHNSQQPPNLDLEHSISSLSLSSNDDNPKELDYLVNRINAAIARKRAANPKEGGNSNSTADSNYAANQDQAADSDHAAEMDNAEDTDGAININDAEEIDYAAEIQLLGNARGDLNSQVQARGLIVRTRMANRYNQRHAVHVFSIGDIVSVGIPRED